MTDLMSSNLGILSGSVMPNSRTRGGGSGGGAGGGNWFEALADSWGKSLDSEAGKIEQMSNRMNDGSDNPSQVTELTAESLRMSFLSQSSQSSIDSVGKALETMARKS